MVVKTIKLTSLFVNTENYRFEPLSSQKEAIDKMVEDQGDKLYSLVDDIVTNGLSPVDLIIVTPNEDNNKYIVLGKSSVSCPLKPSDSAPLKHSTMPP